MTTERDLLVYTDGSYYCRTDIIRSDVDELLEGFDPTDDEWMEVEPDKGHNPDGSPRSVHTGIDRSGWDEWTGGTTSTDTTDDDQGDETPDVELVEVREEPTMGGSQTCYQPVVETDDGTRYQYTGTLQMTEETGREKVEDFDPEGRKWEVID